MAKWNFGKLLQNVTKLKGDLPVVLANQAQRFFVKSFEKQGFEGASGSLMKWKARKNRKDDGRKILVKSGRLRRAVANSIREASWARVRLVVDLPYASIHNDGGTINMPARSQTLSYRKTKGGTLRLTRTRTERQRARVSDQRKVNIGAYKITMPQRRYMGDNPVLRRAQKKTIKQAVDAALKVK